MPDSLNQPKVNSHKAARLLIRMPSMQTFYDLYDACEAIGAFPPSNQSDLPREIGCDVRLKLFDDKPGEKNGSIFVPKGAYDREFHYLLNNYRTHEQARYVPDSLGTDYQKTFHPHEITANTTTATNERSEISDIAEEFFNEHCYPYSPDHEYLISKLIFPPKGSIKKTHIGTCCTYLHWKPYGSKGELSENLLVIPFIRDGRIQTLQFIDESGNKAFLKGVPKKGSYWEIKVPDTKSKGQTIVCIGEGMATVMTYVEILKEQLVKRQKNAQIVGVAAGDSHSLIDAKVALKKEYPQAEFVIVSDVGNGEIDAILAKGNDCHLMKPSFSEEDIAFFEKHFNKKPTDWNDQWVIYHVKKGGSN